jgi:hypothetical protein
LMWNITPRPAPNAAGFRGLARDGIRASGFGHCAD